MDALRQVSPLSVLPSNTYFEKVSEELERIVKELKESPTEDEAHCAATLTDQRPAKGIF